MNGLNCRKICRYLLCSFVVPFNPSLKKKHAKISTTAKFRTFHLSSNLKALHNFYWLCEKFADLDSPTRTIKAIVDEPLIIPCPPGEGHTLTMANGKKNVLEDSDAGVDSWTKVNNGKAIEIDRVHLEHAGPANCTTGGVTSQFYIEVLTPPHGMVLKSNNNYNEFTAGNDVNFTCSTVGGSPPPDNISLYFGNKT